MPQTPRGQLAAVTVVVLLVLAVLALLGQERGRVQREAEAQASLRLLAELHRKYLTKKGVSLADYRKELAAFNREHSGFGDLERYARDAAAE